jgi:hypothetical protein
VALAAGLVAARPWQEILFDGEYGLAVFVDGDTLEVRWLSRQPLPGLLEVEPAGGAGAAAARVTTPAGYAHVARLPRPRADDVVVRYGTDGADQRHSTQLSLRAPRRQPGELPAVDSLYILGDTHGMVDELVAGLRGAGLIDAQQRWSGGRRHVVFAGDLAGRGPYVTPMLWLVYRLEREAAAAGGGVHVLLGNHEIMAMSGDLRYTNPREMQVAEWHRMPYNTLLNTRTSVLGRWLASKPAIMRVGDVLIAHGGISPLLPGTVAQVNDSLHAHLREDLFHYWSDTTRVIRVDAATLASREAFFWSPESPFWHRDYVQTDTLAGQLPEVLRRHRGSVLVVGHTPVETIGKRYEGLLISAHTPQFGAEFVLAVREQGATRWYRVGASGTTPLTR